LRSSNLQPWKSMKRMAKWRRTAWNGVLSALTTMCQRPICVYLVVNMLSTRAVSTSGFRQGKIIVRLVVPRVYRRVLNQFRPLQSHHPRETARLYKPYKNMHVRYPSCFWHQCPHCRCLTLLASCSIPIFDISCPSCPCQRNHPSTTS